MNVIQTSSQSLVYLQHDVVVWCGREGVVGWVNNWVVNVTKSQHFWPGTLERTTAIEEACIKPLVWTIEVVWQLPTGSCQL
jgi:hypothetical protein